MIGGIVNIESDVVAETVNEIFSQRLAVQIFAVGVDVVVGDFVERVRDYRAAWLDLPDLKAASAACCAPRTMS